MDSETEKTRPGSNFLLLQDLQVAELRHIMRLAGDFKAKRRQNLLSGLVLALIFAKPSTRTRLAFEAGMAQLGGHAAVLAQQDLQQSRGEEIADTARTVSGMCDAAAIRAKSHQEIETFAAHASIPVINALSDLEHPCQVLADIMTFEQMRGSISDARIAWVGDVSNVCRSWIAAASHFGFDLRLATPRQYQEDGVLAAAAGRASWCSDPKSAVAGADCVVTDVWISMGDESEAELRRQDFASYTVDADLMRHAAPEAGFMHCLPCRRGEEVSGEVVDGPASWVWQEAENRLHSTKALLVFLLGGLDSLP